MVTTESSGFGDVAQVQILGLDKTTVLATVTGIDLPDTAAAVFFGYGDTGYYYGKYKEYTA